MSKNFCSGDSPGKGYYYCIECGTPIQLNLWEAIPTCTTCKSTSFEKDI